jgi:twitching motility protein PilT
VTTPQNPFEGHYSPEEVTPPVEPQVPAWEAFGAGLPLTPAAPEPAAGLPVSMPAPPPTASDATPDVAVEAFAEVAFIEDGPVAPPAPAGGLPTLPDFPIAPEAPTAPAPSVQFPGAHVPAAQVPGVPVNPMNPVVPVSPAPVVPTPGEMPVAPPAVPGTVPGAVPGLAPGLAAGTAPGLAPAAPGMAPVQPPVAPGPPSVPVAAPMSAPSVVQPGLTQPQAPAHDAPVGRPDSEGPAAPLAGSAPTYEEVVEKVQQVALDEILMAVSEAGGSDLHLASDAPPRMRVRGEISAIKGYQPLTGEQVKSLLYGIMTSKQQARYEEDLGLDFSYTVPGQARFRVNVFQQRGLMGAVMRSIPWEILTFDALNIPSSIGEFSDLKNGLVLVTGPTGSGKSTTLAAILDRANRTRADHIMTVEDPIEFIHQSRKCIVNQREVGADTHSFKDALKFVLRQDPDIILVGEMRDLETISIALTAAETGHLVFGTLHTQSAQDTITRIVDAYPAGEKAQVRAQLAASLRAVVCQTLVPTADRTGRQAALEVMVANSNIKSLIRDDKLQQIQSALQSGAKHGMWTLNHDLARHVLDGRILLSDALDRCSDRADLLNLVGGGDADAAEEAAAKALKRAEEARNPEPKTNPGAMFGGVMPPAPE